MSELDLAPIVHEFFIDAEYPSIIPFINKIRALDEFDLQVLNSSLDKIPVSKLIPWIKKFPKYSAQEYCDCVYDYILSPNRFSMSELAHQLAVNALTYVGGLEHVNARLALDDLSK